MLNCGLVGLPNAGKSTLFNALTRAGAIVAAYPFTTIDPNIGTSTIPDQRLDHLAELIRPERLVPATIQFIDIAGLVRGASTGEGLGNQFLGHLRDTDAIIMVLRCFEHPDVPHLYGAVDPARDAEILALELLLADLAQVERRIERARSAAKSGERRWLAEIALLERLHSHLANGQPARTFLFEGEPANESANDLRLLSGKPVLFVANVSEGQIGQALASLSGGTETLSFIRAIQDLATSRRAEVVAVCAQLEDELNDLPTDEAFEYLETIGATQSGLERLVQASYRLLELITFFTTTGGKEVRAWSIKRGTRASQAAGEIHTDMERGFIRAEVIGVDELVAAGSFARARERGSLHVEGRDYIVQDGDVIHFRFAV
jgi:hypothetical protein